jgi:hypothetical protein
MAAAQAALETPELLEIIITFVPAHQIHSLKSVSKYWNELIKSSQPIRKARCAKPVRWSSKEDVPTYGPNRKIELHPQINYVIGWQVPLGTMLFETFANCTQLFLGESTVVRTVSASASASTVILLRRWKAVVRIMRRVRDARRWP